MTTFPRSPRVLKGAVVALDPFNPVASVIVFQYNPETVSRSVTANMGAVEGDRSDVQRLKGPPSETITMAVEIDATDQLETGEGRGRELGVYPQLSALEMILYPKSLHTIANTALSFVGTLELVPPEAPMTLLIWGIKRVVPVRLSSFTINEQAFDANLNPIRANVSLDLKVLSTNDFPTLHAGYALFLTHQIVKETMAVLGSVDNLSAIGTGDVSLI